MDTSGLVEVRVGDCACPDTPHEGDVVYLLPKLGLEGGTAAEFDLLFSREIEDAARSTLVLLARWTVTFVRYGAVGWNRVRLDERGRPEPEPFDVEALIADYAAARLIAERANELYSEAVMRPLFEAARASEPSPNRAQRRSRTGRTGGSTSRRPASIRSRPESSSQDASAGPPLRIAR